MPLSLEPLVTSSLPIEVDGLTPDWAAGKSLAEIQRFEVLHGNHRVAVAELFRVSGDAADKRIVARRAYGFLLETFML